MTLSGPGQDLLERFLAVTMEGTIPKNGDVVHVDEIAAKFAVFYEKVRNVVHYHDEHLVRKIFILRAIRRRLFLVLASQKNIAAEPLVRELVRAGYLANDSVGNTKIAEVQGIIDNYYELTRQIKAIHRRSAGLPDWVLDLTVSAIEEALFPLDVNDELAFDLLYKTIRSNLVVRGAQAKETEKDTQLFIAMQRVFLRADGAQIQYRLLLILYPDWKTLSGDAREAFVRELPRIKNDFDKLPRGRLSPLFVKFCNHYNIVYSTVRDILNEARGHETLQEVLTSEEALERVTRVVYERRLQEEFIRFKRIAVFSVVSFFLSKIAIGLLAEIPIERATDTFSLPVTIFSVLFPPVLMFIIIILFVRLPSEANLRLIVYEVKKSFYDPWPREYGIQVPAQQSVVMKFFVTFFYLAISIGIFFLATKVLLSLNFSIANSVIFLLFTSLVVATGVKIYNRAQNLSLEEENAGTLAFIFDLFIMPFVILGHWMIARLTRFSVITIAINLIIELPFQIFIEFLENLRRFIKIKKEEID